MPWHLAGGEPHTVTFVRRAVLSRATMFRNFGGAGVPGTPGDRPLRRYTARNFRQPRPNENWVSGGVPMSALEPTPVANPRIWALPPVARRGHLVSPDPFARLNGFRSLACSPSRLPESGLRGSLGSAEQEGCQESKQHNDVKQMPSTMNYCNLLCIWEALGYRFFDDGA